MGVAIVLATVNTPYSEQLDAAALAHCIVDQTAAKHAPGHMSSFLGEVESALQIEFAQLFNIADETLKASAKLFALYSGESHPLAA